MRVIGYDSISDWNAFAVGNIPPNCIDSYCLVEAIFVTENWFAYRVKVETAARCGNSIPMPRNHPLNPFRGYMIGIWHDFDKNKSPAATILRIEL